MKGKKECVLSEVDVLSNESQYLQFFRPPAWNCTLVVQTCLLLILAECGVEGSSASLKRVRVFWVLYRCHLKWEVASWCSTWWCEKYLVKMKNTLWRGPDSSWKPREYYWCENGNLRELMCVPWTMWFFIYFISIGSLLGSVLMKCGFPVYSFVGNANAFIIQSCF